MRGFESSCEVAVPSSRPLFSIKGILRPSPDYQKMIPAQVYPLRYTPAGIPDRVPFFWSILDRQYSIGYMYVLWRGIIASILCYKRCGFRFQVVIGCIRNHQ